MWGENRFCIQGKIYYAGGSVTNAMEILIAFQYKLYICNIVFSFKFV